MKIRTKDVLRELRRRGDVRFGEDDNRRALDEVRLNLARYAYELEALEGQYKHNIYQEIARYGLDQKYKKNLEVELKSIFSESRLLGDSIKKIKDKIAMTLNKIK